MPATDSIAPPLPEPAAAVEGASLLGPRHVAAGESNCDAASSVGPAAYEGSFPATGSAYISPPDHTPIAPFPLPDTTEDVEELELEVDSYDIPGAVETDRRQLR